MKRILITAMESSAGKTVLTCALLQALQNRGLSAASFKCGPDYIDPLFHRRVLGVPGSNLDLFLQGEGGVHRALARPEADVAVIEGAMGFFDGAGGTDEASAWQIAVREDIPALLAIRPRGSSLTLAAQVRGMLQFRRPSKIAALFLTDCRPGLYEHLRGIFEREIGLPMIGYLPPMEEARFESRHLGLITAAEIEDFRQRFCAISEKLEETADIDRLLRISKEAGTTEQPLPVSKEAGTTEQPFPVSKEAGTTEQPLPVSKEAGTIERSLPVSKEAGTTEQPFPMSKETGNINRLSKLPVTPVASQPQNMEKPGPCESEQLLAAPICRIAVARDPAFCFYYEEGLARLQECGAELIFFQPLYDKALPAADGLYLGGGYPELYAKELAGNDTMRQAVRRAVTDGMPTVAECGGFLYLQQTLEDVNGTAWPMAGALPGRGFPARGLVRFGYVKLTAERDSLLFRCGEPVPAHEFHHWDSTENGTALAAVKPSGRAWRCGYASPTLYAAFPHLHFGGELPLAERFVEAAVQYKKTRHRRDD